MPSTKSRINHSYNPAYLVFVLLSLLVYAVLPAHANAALGDGGPAIDACLLHPTSVAVDFVGNVYIADDGNNRIRKVDAATGIITTIVGDGQKVAETVLAAESRERHLYSLVIDPDGNLLFTDSFNAVRKLDMNTRMITTIVGGGMTPIDPWQNITGA